QQLTRAGLAGAPLDTAAAGTKPATLRIGTAASTANAPATAESTSAAIDFRAAAARGELFNFEGAGLTDANRVDALDATTALVGRMLANTGAADAPNGDNGKPK